MPFTTRKESHPGAAGYGQNRPESDIPHIPVKVSDAAFQVIHIFTIVLYLSAKPSHIPDIENPANCRASIMAKIYPLYQVASVPTIYVRLLLYYPHLPHQYASYSVPALHLTVDNSLLAMFSLLATDDMDDVLSRINKRLGFGLVKFPRFHKAVHLVDEVA